MVKQSSFQLTPQSRGFHIITNEVIRQLEVRHRRRQASIDNAHHKQVVLELSKNAVNF